MRPFRFSAALPAFTGDLRAWRQKVARIADLGFDTLTAGDDLASGGMDPLVVLAAALHAAPGVRLQTRALTVGLRHPVMAQRALASLDAFSDGRLDIGLGVGFGDTPADHQALGRTADPAPLRCERLADTARTLRTLFTAQPATSHGLGRPGACPPILIAGHSRGVLDVAGRHADIIAITPPHTGGHSGPLGVDAVATRLGWARAAATAAGRDPDQLDYQLPILAIDVTDTSHPAWTAPQFAGLSQPALVLSPAAVSGPAGHCARLLAARRARLGVNHLHFTGGLRAAATVIAHLRALS
ncbi:LLM class flavin-dependent oxidoreductase [Longispora sp. NPDC051575]|uniref:LLM class flavin-dependent oxidoreductase n=1 Tax=Longispora sp. NPDC051575 TaxID=3154943 RepID=UPI0034308EC5